MAGTVVDKLHEDNSAILNRLLEGNEISMAADLDNKLKKVLVMAAASYFESEIRSVIETFVTAAANGNVAVVSFVKIKAIERQFHTLFSWKERNANTFFSAFGEEFSKSCRVAVSADSALADSIAAFLEIGETRNKLAHLNFASFPVEKTAQEIYDLYRKALPFLDYLRTRLVEQSGIVPIV
jgi:hypothetical protein